MPTNVAIVDDRDSLITYAGDWSNDGTAVAFRGTTRWSPTVGSTATFTFSGTSITVFASVANINPAIASVSFSIDGHVSGSYTPANDIAGGIFHEALWTSSSLSDGTHTLVITQTKAGSSGQIYIDYLQYTTTSTDVGAYFIDDRDARVTYNPGWQQFGSENDFQHTSQRSSNVGDSVTLQFEGKAVAMYGGLTLETPGMRASIVLDGGAPTTYNAPSDGSSTNNLYFQSPLLSDGAHTLVVTVETEQHLWADYFLVTPSASGGTTAAPPPVTPPSTTSPSTVTPPFTTTSPSTPGASSVSSDGTSAPAGTHSPATGGHTIAFGGSTGTSGSTPLPSGATSPAASPATSALSGSNSGGSQLPAVAATTKPTPTAAIVAAVLGTLLLVAVLLGLFLCLRRRKRRLAQRDGALNPNIPRPFTDFTAPGGSNAYAALAAGSTANLCGAGLTSSGQSSSTPPSTDDPKLAAETRWHHPSPSATFSLSPSASVSRAGSVVSVSRAASVSSSPSPQMSIVPPPTTTPSILGSGSMAGASDAPPQYSA
ncbi:hypothetical protein DFH09DRAFT_1325278 [Mycena vulgaris]|nr:hypothetical protein DFH09DRAFT_1325278 [Mycena vulgaris]